MSSVSPSLNGFFLKKQHRHLLLGGWNKGKRQDYLLHALGGGIGQHPDIPGDKILLPEVTLIIKKCRDPFFCC